MLLATGTSFLLLGFAGACAHRLWFGDRIWQALVFLPPMIATWAASLVVRTPTDMGALITFLSGDLALYALAVLGVMRMLGGLPIRPGDDDGDDSGWDGDDDDEGVPPWSPPSTLGHDRRRPLAGLRPSRANRPIQPRPKRHPGVRRPQPDRDAPRGTRAPVTSSSDRTD